MEIRLATEAVIAISTATQKCLMREPGVGGNLDVWATMVPRPREVGKVVGAALSVETARLYESAVGGDAASGVE